MSKMVSKDQFDEFTKRMEQGFEHVSARFDHVDQRFDEMGRRFDQRHTDLRADIRQMRNWWHEVFEADYRKPGQHLVYASLDLSRLDILDLSRNPPVDF